MSRTIETKYDVGAEVFFMHNNKIHSGKISKISVDVIGIIDSLTSNTPHFHFPEKKEVIKYTTRFFKLDSKSFDTFTTYGDNLFDCRDKLIDSL